MIDFTMARVLKGYPGLVARYQGQQTTVPVLLQPVGLPPTDGEADGTVPQLATLAAVQLGSRLRLILPWMVAPEGTSGAETTYTYTPIWRLRSPVTAAGGSRLGHGVTQDAGAGLTKQLAPAWLGTPITPPAPSTVAYPREPANIALGAFRTYAGGLWSSTAPSPTYVAPFSSYELLCEGDEFGLLVQPTGGARAWDFAANAVDANFATQYAESPYLSPAYQEALGAYILTGERSP